MQFLKVTNKLISLENLFCLVIFSMPLYLVRINILGLPTNIFEVFAILTIILFFLKKSNAFIANLKNLPKIAILAILFILTGLLISIFSNTPHLPGLSILKSWFLLPILFSYALYAVIKSETAVEKIFASIYFSAALVGMISVVYKIFGIVTYDNRLEAFYLSPNYLAMYLSPGIFFGIYFLVKSLKNNSSLSNTLMHVLLLALLFVPLYYTYSYGAWLAVFVSLFVIFIFAANKKRLLITGAFAMVFAAFFVFQTSSQKFLNLFSERSSAMSRTMVWDASLLMLKQRPFLGIGPGNFQENYLLLQKNFPPYLEWAVPQPHNIFLAFWLQSGLLGLIGFLLLLFFIFKKFFITIKNKKDALLVAPLLGFFIYTILHGLIDTPYWKNDLSFLFWICTFLTLFVYNNSKQKF